MVLAIVLLYMMAHEGKVALYMNQITKLFVVIAGMGIVYMVLSIFGGFSALGSSRYAVKEIERGIIYILIAQIIMRSKVDIRKYISIWNMLLTLSVVVAILQFTKVIDMNTILKNFYGDSIQFYNTQFTVLSSFRCGVSGQSLGCIPKIWLWLYEKYCSLSTLHYWVCVGRITHRFCFRCGDSYLSFVYRRKSKSRICNAFSGNNAVLLSDLRLIHESNWKYRFWYFG